MEGRLQHSKTETVLYP